MKTLDHDYKPQAAEEQRLSRLDMAPPAEDYYCHQFQANAFDPLRCSSCLRPAHMHLSSSSSSTAATEAQQEWDDDNGVLSEVTSSASSDDISGAWTYEWSLVHSLSPDWELNTCDTDIQSSSLNQGVHPEKSRPGSSERHCAAQRDMTRLDPSPQQDTESSWMDERRGRDRSRRPSESRGDRVQESGYFSPERRGGGERQSEEVNKRPYRYYERGHPLPSNYVLEPKACVPYRNVNLGVPSQRRNTETYMQESWRSESPQRYTYHSNFRPGADSQRNSPTRHSSVSPDRYKLTEYPAEAHRGGSLSRSQAQSQASSHGSSRLPSHAPSRHTSGRSSPSRGRGSNASRTRSPSRATPSGRRAESFHLQNDDYNSQKARSRESRTPSQASNKHSLDSEKLYRNLESISRRGSSAVQQHSHEGSQASPRTRTAANSLGTTHTHNSREASPPRSGYGTNSHTPQRDLHSRSSRPSPSQESWQGSSHSLLSLPHSRGSSTSRRGADYQALGGSLSHAATTETDKCNKENKMLNGDRSRSNMRRGMEVLLISEPNKAAVDAEEVGMTMDDYIVLADIPKIQLESEEEFPGLKRRNQSPSPCRDQRPRTYRYPDEIDLYGSRLESDERGRCRERGRDRREKCHNGRSSRKQSTASLHTQSSDNESGKHRSSKLKEQVHPECPQTQWRKHWFVLGDTSLRYYRDSEAEESDDLDGEIDLMSCVSVSDCDIEKNYGIQIQTKRTVFTLSAVTSRIRRNWVKLLKQAIQNNRHQSGTGSEKANPLAQRPSSCQPPAQFTCKDSGCEPTTSTSATTAVNSHLDNHHHQTENGDPDTGLSPASQREAGEGWDRDQAKRLEERNKWFEEGVSFNDMGSRWDSMELKKGTVPVPVTETMDLQVNRKWAEFETLPFTDMSAQSLIGSQAYQSSSPEGSKSPVNSHTYQLSPEEAEQPVSGSQSVNSVQNSQTKTAEALKKEAQSLRKQVESIKRERAAMEIEVDSPCGPGAPCRARLEAMEVAHRKALQELQEKHKREIRELEDERDRMLQDKSEAAARAMEALKTAHKEEIEREVEKARKLSEGAAHVDASYTGQMPQANELDVLSERYTQKCLELHSTEQTSKSRENELFHKEREVDELKRENQELKTKLAEEISRMRHFITGQRSDRPMASPGNTECTAAEVEMLLRAKENEVQYLKKEISCLQNEVQSLTKEKEAAYERYKDAYVELTEMKGRSQLDMGSLNEHLRLTKAALQEGARQT